MFFKIQADLLLCLISEESSYARQRIPFFTGALLCWAGSQTGMTIFLFEKPVSDDPSQNSAGAVPGGT